MALPILQKIWPKRFWFWQGMVLLLTISFSITFFRYRAAHAETDSNLTPEQILAGKVTERELPDEVAQIDSLSILILGYGGGGHSGGMLTDVIQLVQIDLKKQQVYLISLPRDLWVTLPDGKSAKINKAFTMGDNPAEPIKSGGQVSKQMVSVVTGLPVDYFISVDFVGFKRLIGEVMKGVEVEVAETLDDPWYPITGNEQESCGKSPEEIATLSATLSGFELEKQFECRYEHIHFDPGTVTMEGSDALAYVRSRHGSAGGDFSRSRRQQEILEGIKKKLFSMQFIDQAPTIFEQASYTFNTDFDLGIVTKLAPLVSKVQNFKITTINLSTDNVLVTSKSADGQFILLPKTEDGTWGTVQEYLQKEME